MIFNCACSDKLVCMSVTRVCSLVFCGWFWMLNLDKGLVFIKYQKATIKVILIHYLQFKLCNIY